MTARFLDSTLKCFTAALIFECPRGGGGGRESNGPPIGFSTLSLKISSNRNETFSTCSPIMGTFCDTNWITSSLIIYAQLVIQINF